MLKDLILDAYAEKIFRRFDDETTFFFNKDHFPGLIEEPFDFKSFKKDTLRGNFHYYPGYKENHIIVFDHGMGAGYTAYYREIELLCKQGYLVYSYDHTGCMKSEGLHAEGFLQSLVDLDCCLTTLKENFPNHKISVIGHSWGGFSTSNIAAFHPDVAHVISLAPFNSLSSILHQSFHGILGFAYKYAYQFEESFNPEYAEASAIEALKKYSGHALIIHSKDDPVLKVKYHFDKIKKALKGSQNIEFLLVNKKRHNPNYTENAVVLLQEYLTLREKLNKDGILVEPEDYEEFNSQFDWYNITEQDMEIWTRIFEVLEK